MAPLAVTLRLIEEEEFQILTPDVPARTVGFVEFGEEQDREMMMANKSLVTFGIRAPNTTIDCADAANIECGLNEVIEAGKKCNT